MQYSMFTAYKIQHYFVLVQDITAKQIYVLNLETQANCCINFAVNEEERLLTVTNVKNILTNKQVRIYNLSYLFGCVVQLAIIDVSYSFQRFPKINMHSLLQRGNSILAYALSVLACLTFICFASTVFLNYVTDAKINTVKVVV